MKLEYDFFLFPRFSDSIGRNDDDDDDKAMSSSSAIWSPAVIRRHQRNKSVSSISNLNPRPFKKPTTIGSSEDILAHSLNECREETENLRQAIGEEKVAVVPKSDYVERLRRASGDLVGNKVRIKKSGKKEI